MPGSIFTGDDDEVQENQFSDLSDDTETSSEQLVGAYADVVETPTSDYQEESLDSEISEAERRFNKAALYKQWISGSLFGGADQPEVLEVEAEFKDFARKQLKKLIGIDQEAPTVDSVFTAEEVTALKTIAAQVLKNPKLGKVEPKPAPKKPPVLKPRVAPVKPEAPVLVQRPQAPKPAPVQQTKPPVTNRVPQQANLRHVTAPKPGTIPANESVIQQGGKTWKIQHVEASMNEFGPASTQIIKMLRPGQAGKTAQDIQVYKDASGKLFKVIKKDITLFKKPDGMVPFPDQGQMTMVTQNMSELAALSSMAQGDRNIAGRR